MSTPQISTMFSRYNDAEFDTKAMSIYEALNGNSYFPDLPGLAELKTAFDNFRAALVTAQNGGRMEIVEKIKQKNCCATNCTNWECLLRLPPKAIKPYSSAGVQPDKRITVQAADRSAAKAGSEKWHQPG